MTENFYLYHKPQSQVLLKGYCGCNQDYTCTLDIAESTWFKVSNGVNRTLGGKGYFKGKAIKTKWIFTDGAIAITSSDATIYEGSISAIKDKSEDDVTTSW